MNITQCSKQLRELTDARDQYKMTAEAYRIQRKTLFDTLDQNLNGISADQPPEPSLVREENSVDDQDKTQPYLAGKIGKCINFFKGTNEEK